MDECEGVCVCMRESACALDEEDEEEEEGEKRRRSRRRRKIGEEMEKEKRRRKGTGGTEERPKFNVFSSLRWPLGPFVLFCYQSQARDSSHAKDL